MIKKVFALLMSCVIASTGLFLGGAIDTAYAAEAQVVSITASRTELSAKGGDISLEITGENLTEESYSLEIMRYIDLGDDMLVDVKEDSTTAPQATISDRSATGATLNISANKMNNNIRIVVNVIVNKNTVASTAIIVKTKGYRTEGISPSKAEMTGNNEILVTFPKAITEAEDENFDTMEKVWLELGGVKYTLGEEDKVEFGDDSISIITKESLTTIFDEIKTSSDSSFDNATIKVCLDENLFTFTGSIGEARANAALTSGWEVQKKACITSVVLDRDVIEYTGGHITGLLGGYKSEEVSLDRVTAEVFVGGENKASSIPVTLSRDSDGTTKAEFDVPQNDSNRTECYWLNIKIDGVTLYQGTNENKAQKAAVSVVAKGVSLDTPTIGAVSISANNYEMIDGGIQVNVQKSIGSLKTELRIYGTGLDDETTRLRITDENGIEWPVYDIPECDGKWRFIAIAGIKKNGIFGNGNTQIIELLPPRYAGTNKTYTVEVSADGVNYDSDSAIKLVINNEGISDESEFTECSANDFKYVTVKYVDESGNEIAYEEIYKGYSITMIQQFKISAKSVPGYELISEPEFPEWVGTSEEPYIYQYRKCIPVEGNNAVAATYWSTGRTADLVCSNCGEFLSEGKTIAKKKVTAPALKGGKKYFVVKKAAVKGATGYQIQYSRSSKFTKVKTVTIKSGKGFAKKISKLSSKKRYYVRMRAMRKVAGKTYYSNWTKTISVKTR